MRPISEMAVFIEVVQQGSFSAAARRLGIAVSVVADRVTGLEKRLGIRLLTRTTRNQALTEAGMTYFEEARTIVAAVTGLEARLMEESTSPRGTLKVTAPTPIGRWLIGPFVGDFARRYPDIGIHLTLEDRFADIVGEGFDIAIRGAPMVDSSLMGRRLFETRRVVVGSPDYVKRRGYPRSPAELVGHDCLLFNKDQHFQTEWRFGRGIEAHNVRIAGRIATTNSELPLAWALAGLGLTQKSWWEVAHHIRAGLLNTVLDEFEPDPATFFAIHPVSHAMSRKVALFIDSLAAEFKNPDWISAGAAGRPIGSR
jgi:LysR family transcriptional regulator, transcriptional activator for dmlA